MCGPGGIGKTRLAARAAWEARRAFPDGVWLVELAGLGDPALLAAVVARGVGLLDQSAGWALATLSAHLADWQALIAERMVISTRTAETHVQHIMDKLGFSARSQIAAWRTRRPGRAGSEDT